MIPIGLNNPWLILVGFLAIVVLYLMLELSKTREKLDIQVSEMMQTSIRFSTLLERLVSNVPENQKELLAELKEMKTHLSNRIERLGDEVRNKRHT